MNASAKMIGLDIAKNVFVAVGHDEHSKMAIKHKLRRDEVLPIFANMPATHIAIEACAGRIIGHEISLHWGMK